MIIYEVWDHYPMDGGAGKDYLAQRYRSKAKAQADMEQRNAEWRSYFEANATDGLRRAVAEPWNWRFARVVAVHTD